MENLIIAQELEGLPESKALQIKAVYEPMIKMLEDFEGAYNELMAEEQTPEKCERAKELRGKIARVRIDSDKARRNIKKEYLLAGRAVDSAHKTLEFGIGNKEKELKEVENFYELQEEERAAKVQAEREAELAKYSVTIQTPDMLGRMTNDVWINYLNGVKLNWEAVKEAERKAEEERLEAERRQAEERERVRKENEGLKAEKEKFLIEKNHRDIEQREREKEQEKVIKEQKQKLLKEQQEREKLEREHIAKEEQRKEAGRKRALAPDKEKLLYFADALEKKKDTVESQQAKGALSRAAQVLQEEASKL